MITPMQYAQMLSRTQRNPSREAPGGAVALEAPLQDQIEAECRRRGWPFVRTRMDRKTTFTMEGIPDFVIAADGGKTLWVECKRKNAKQTVEQRGFQMMLERIGHGYHLVRSFSEFLDALRRPNENPPHVDAVEGDF